MPRALGGHVLTGRRGARARHWRSLTLEAWSSRQRSPSRVEGGHRPTTRCGDVGPLHHEGGMAWVAAARAGPHLTIGSVSAESLHRGDEASVVVAGRVTHNDG